MTARYPLPEPSARSCRARRHLTTASTDLGQRQVDQQNAAQRKQEEEILHSTATRTTAEPRVNAYIPDGEYGLPKAYGAHAPFMPTVLGTTARHIRKPNPKPIEI